MHREILLLDKDYFSMHSEKTLVLWNISVLFTASMIGSNKEKNIGLSLVQEEFKEIENMLVLLTPEKIKETLSELTRREILLLIDDRFSNDLEMREITHLF